MKLPLGLALLLSLGACSGTDVGNSSPQMWVSAENSTASASVLSTSEENPIFESFQLQFRRIGIPAQNDCSTALEPSASWWILKIKSIFTLGEGPLSLDLPDSQSTDRPASFCQIRLVLGPSLESPNSIKIVGQKDGVDFEVLSSQLHLLVIRSTSPISLEQESSRNIHNILSLENLLEDVNLSLLGPSPVSITPTGTPIAFGVVMRNIRRHFAAYPLNLKDSQNPITDRGNKLGEGDENETEFKEGESDI